ncbi:MAG: deoxyribonuclease IV, partial [Nitrososphaerales archaeon]
RYPAVHMPYLPNLASPNDEIYGKSVSILTAELDRCGALHIPYLVTHLGSHLGRGEMFGLKRIIEACSRALSEVDNDVMILLENTAGTKNSVGSTFENLRYVSGNVEPDRRVGICFDTSHAFAAGYDLRSDEDVDRSLGLLDDIIGLDKVKVVHLNDSKGAFNSHSDRHDHIGLGYIGEDGFRAFLRHKLAKTRPLVMETPVDSRRDDVGNLKKVRELAGEG